MTKQNHGYYIYLLKEKVTRKVLYVGCTIHPMRRLSEHKDAIVNNSAPLYEYIRSNGFELFTDIEFHLVDKTTTLDTEEAELLEQKYTKEHKDTVLNVYMGNKRHNQFSNKNKRIRCVTDGKTYPSVKKVLESYEGVTNIYSHLKRGTRLKNGLVFEYVDDSNITEHVWAIQCLNDGVKFSSIKLCAEHYGISADILYHGDKSGKPFVISKNNIDLEFVRLG